MKINQEYWWSECDRDMQMMHLQVNSIIDLGNLQIMWHKFVAATYRTWYGILFVFAGHEFCCTDMPHTMQHWRRLH